MNVQAALKGQYHAALAMLKQAIDECPKEMWAGGPSPKTPVAFWRVVYHTLYYTHMYLARDRKSFRPWKHHREGCQHLKRPTMARGVKAKKVTPYSKADVLAYWELLDGAIDATVDKLDLDAKECGFWWYKLPKLDHQINNIRHVQHHAALLSGRLRQAQGISIQWVGFG